MGDVHAQRVKQQVERIQSGLKTRCLIQRLWHHTSITVFVVPVEAALRTSRRRM
jgi:hypothetical protein